MNGLFFLFSSTLKKIQRTIITTQTANRPFSLVDLFSQYRSCDDKGLNLLGIVTWSVLGKQNRQARKVYCRCAWNRAQGVYVGRVVQVGCNCQWWMRPIESHKLYARSVCDLFAWPLFCLFPARGSYLIFFCLKVAIIKLSLKVHKASFVLLHVSSNALNLLTSALPSISHTGSRPTFRATGDGESCSEVPGSNGSWSVRNFCGPTKRDKELMNIISN